jgi:hypothetical protein
MQAAGKPDIFHRLAPYGFWKSLVETAHISLQRITALQKGTPA